VFNTAVTGTEFAFVVTGVLIIIYGLIIFTGRKFMIKREYDSIFTIFIIILFNALRYFEDVLSSGRSHNIVSILFNDIRYIEWGDVLSLLFITFIFILAVMITIGRYTLINVNSKMVLDTLTEILKEKGISYEEEENYVILRDLDNKRISYTQSLNSAEVDLRDIRKTSFYKELKQELGCRIKKIKVRVFPATGLLLIGLGVITMAIPQYLGKIL
jgi:hypothetical protein